MPEVKAAARARAIDDALATEADTTRRQAEERPNHPALIFGDRVTTYGELDRRANQVANGLLALEARPQQRVALLSKNSDVFFEVLFGIFKARAVALPVNWRLAPREIAAVLADAQTDTLFVGSEFLSMLPQLQQLGVQLKQVFVLDGTAAGVQSYAVWRNTQSEVDPRIEISPDDIFMQLYTSGTTGGPKGVQLSHRASLQMRALEVGTGNPWTEWGPDDVAIVAMPNFHVSGTSWALQWLARGATCVVLPQVEARAILEAIDRHGVTQVFVVPTVLDMMLRDETCAGRDFSRLELIHYGGAPITPVLLTRCLETFGTDFVQYYGMTETNGIVCVLEPHDHDVRQPERLKSCGKPYPAVDMKVMDAEGNVLPPRQVGEICVRTPCLMSGYWRLPQAMASCMQGNHYRTGDAGFMDEDGYVFLVDRIKDMIVSGGENIYPVEVERVLAEHPAVVDSAVIGIPDERWGEAVKAVVVSSDPALNAETLLAFIRERIARYKVPKTVDFVDALPRNPSGKILKRELRDRYRR